MVALIEDQIHQFLIEQEEKRCAALEAEYRKTKEAPEEKIKRKAIIKPWKRPSEVALCQEIELLVMVDEYDYDLSNENFQSYCASRGILHVAGEQGSRRWEFVANFTKTKQDFFADAYFQYAEEVNGTRYRYTEQEMETAWKITVLGRAKLQDCWELFSRLQTSA